MKSMIGIQCFTQQQIARSVVGDGKRITVTLVAQHEFALIIGRPQIVGVQAFRQGGAFGPQP